MRYHHACCISLFIYIIYLQYVCIYVSVHVYMLKKKMMMMLDSLREDDDARDLDTGVAAVTEDALFRTRLDLSAPLVLVFIICLALKA